MVKCVVSGCPNREAVSVNRGVFHRKPKRFFNFPKDPARVKVWLAALRETNKQDSTEQHLICEDHFLPEDISKNGVNSDAIPIMPPYLDGPMGLISPWGAESSEEEEDQWTNAGGCDDDEANEGDDAPAHVEPPVPAPHAVDPPQQDLGANKTSGAKTTGVTPHQKKEGIQTTRATRQDVSLGMLTQRFLELLLTAPDGSLDLRQVTTSLQTRRRRVYDITNVLEGINLIEKQSTNRVKWIGSCHISNFLWMSQQRVQKELDNLKLVENTLDTFIKSCAQQLFDMTDDLENAAYPFTPELARERVLESAERCAERIAPGWPPGGASSPHSSYPSPDNLQKPKYREIVSRKSHHNIQTSSRNPAVKLWLNPLRVSLPSIKLSERPTEHFEPSYILGFVDDALIQRSSLTVTAAEERASVARPPALQETNRKEESALRHVFASLCAPGLPVSLRLERFGHHERLEGFSPGAGRVRRGGGGGGGGGGVRGG
ncbi:hypothetical protein FQN60_015463 [Etheostoma spectabile]|uniref:THAP-type domain-containing protein n=1 Tax=Etheostoma spectabile TaxID=54343 RepID=A0A5J5CMI3_9PERO|nr:hypothetical protein FQN60_015463 [Etheostoma spectabile]